VCTIYRTIRNKLISRFEERTRPHISGRVILPRVGVTIDGVWIERLDLLTPYTFNSGLRATQRYRWSTRFPGHRYRRPWVLSLPQAFPVNGFITVSLSLQITHEVFFSPCNSLFTIVLQLPILKIRLNLIPLLQSSYSGRLVSRNSTLFYTAKHFFITTLQGRRRKHSLIVKKEFLLIRCLAMDVILLVVISVCS
jgi:hypothetical protein